MNSCDCDLLPSGLLFRLPYLKSGNITIIRSLLYLLVTAFLLVNDVTWEFKSEKVIKTIY